MVKDFLFSDWEGEAPAEPCLSNRVPLLAGPAVCRRNFSLALILRREGGSLPSQADGFSVGRRSHWDAD